MGFYFNSDSLTPSKGSEGGGSIPVIDSLNVTPTTSAQIITAPSGTDGYSPINVSAVTSSIDANITAGNIKKDVQILGVTGTYEGSGGGIQREVSAQGVYMAPIQPFTFTLPNNATSIGQYGLYYSLYNCQGITSANLSSITTLPNSDALNNAFYQCSNLESVDLSSLTSVSGARSLEMAFTFCSSLITVDLSSLATVSGLKAFNEAFESCESLSTINLSSLTTVSGQEAFYMAFSGCIVAESLDLSSLTTVSGKCAMLGAFSGCGLTTVDISSLTTVSGQEAFNGAFIGCNSLESVTFTSLSSITGKLAFTQAFMSCFSLTSISFPALTTNSFGSNRDQFTDMLDSMSKNLTIHFPSNLQSTISGLSGYPGFGDHMGTVTLAFDLPATS